LLGVLARSGWVNGAFAADRPNVVLMLSDNLGFGDLGAYGSGGAMRGMPTPNIDQLASKGLMMTQSA
jgi:arylsulfatase